MKTVWNDVYLDYPYAKYPSDDLIRFMVNNFTDSFKMKVLEIGCGAGSGLWYLVREGYEVYGIDGSKTAIDITRRKLNEENSSWVGKLKVGDFCEPLPFEKDFFDAVIDNEAIYSNSFDDSKKAYKNMYEVCKPGGRMFSRTFAAGSWGDNTGKPMGYGAWLCAEGPLKNKGLSRFTGIKEIKDLVGEFKINRVELLTRTVNDGVDIIKEWIIWATK